MPVSTGYRFGPFEIDLRRRLLLRDGRPAALTAKALETLLALVERAGEVVEKDTLMGRLWPDTAVEEGNLTQQISTVRKALGEAPDDHQFIVTVARRGYRFVAPVTAVAGVSSAKGAPTIGRDRELADLEQILDVVAGGCGTIVSVTGEAGIGKSTLVSEFLNRSAAAAVVLHGRCSERLAPGEPHLPILEALEELLRNVPRPLVAELLAARAPSWWLQIAPLISDAAAAPAPPSSGATQERQKRELAAFLLDLARSRPVILFLDDLHWADVSTLDLVLYLASRLADMRLLIVIAYRPAELLSTQDAFVQSLRDLRARGSLREITLPFLSRDDVSRYIATEFANHAFPEAFPALVHERTEGNPLFLVDLLRDLRERGSIARREAGWELMMSVSKVAEDLPPSVRSLIERTIARLDDLDRQLLVAGSVQGAEFDSVVVAVALGIDAALVEERLDRLARIHALIRVVDRNDAAAQAPNVRYAFVHVLYQHSLYASLMPSRKASLSVAVAEALRATTAEPPAKLAHQLALLFEAGRRPAEAVDAFLLAAQHAVSVSAGREAAALARRGLSLVTALPATPEHLARELQLLITLGVPLAATTGYASPEVERTYTRARDLCRELNASEALFPVLLGQWVLYHVRADLAQAATAGEQLLALGERTGDARVLESAHTILGYTRGHLGELEGALGHLARAESAGDPSHHAFYRSINALDPAVACLCQQGRVLCLMGETDRAVDRVERALEMARALGAPNAIGFALVWSAYVHQLRLEPERVRVLTEEALALATEHGLADVRGWAAVLYAWAGDDPLDGAVIIRESLAAQRSFGSEIARPHQLGLLADVLIRAGDLAQASATVDEALAQIARTGDRYYEPALYLLKGDDQQALESARRQGSGLFEQRALRKLAVVAR